jgi:adenosine deaminase
MVMQGATVNFTPSQVKLYRPKVQAFRGNSVSKPEKPDSEKDSKEKKIPDPIYNFFFDLPKYELHAHFNGSTPLNISKLFLNKENQCIGMTEEELEAKYNDIRKKSESLADWLKKTYELKAKNITTMDIMTAAYAIAMEEAKHNARYLEIRIDPFSSSFVGSPEDIIRATEVGLRNAREDIKEQGKDIKTGIILLAERHGSPEKALQTAKMSTSLRSQRVLFEDMYQELKAAEKKGEAYESSDILAKNFLELMKIRKVFSGVNEVAKDIYTTQNPDYEKASAKIDLLKNLYERNLESKGGTKIPMKTIDKFYKELTVSKTKSISTIDLVPAVYSIVTELALSGEREINMALDPTLNMYRGKPEDILRAVQVGMRNAEIDLRKKNIQIKTSIIIEADPKSTDASKSEQLARLAVQMKSQRVLFDNMYTEMKEAVAKDKIYEHSEILDSLEDDMAAYKDFKKEVETIIKRDAQNPANVRKNVLLAYREVLQKIENPTTLIKLKKAVKAFTDNLKAHEIAVSQNDALLEHFNKAFKSADEYLDEKTFLAEKIFDNLKHYSNLQLKDKANGTKLCDRYLRMGTGIIPNVVALALYEDGDSKLQTKHVEAKEYVNVYNKRKKLKEEKLIIYKNHDFKAVDLKEDIINNKCCNGKDFDSYDAAIGLDGNEFNSFDQSDINPVYSKGKIVQDLDKVLKLSRDQNAPETYKKNVSTKTLREISDKLNTQFKLEEQKFLLSRQILESLKNYSELRLLDKEQGTKDAIHYARMGLNIIPNVVAYDIAGNENDYPLYVHNKALKHIKYYNETKSNPYEELKVTIHAGEVKESGKTEGMKNAYQQVDKTKDGKPIYKNVVTGEIKTLEELKDRPNAYEVIKNDKDGKPQYKNIHTGEVKDTIGLEGWENIHEAIKNGAHRIGHGIDLRRAPEWLKEEVKYRNVLMETCPKVNYQTKAVVGYREHPILDFLDQDIPANINTDNPVTAGSNMTNEFVQLFKRFNMGITPEERANGINERFTLGHVKKLLNNAIWSTFALTPEEKKAEEKFAIDQLEKAIDKYEDKVVLNDNEPIMMKVQKQVIAFTGSIKKVWATQMDKNRAA